MRWPVDEGSDPGFQSALLNPPLISLKLLLSSCWDAITFLRPMPQKGHAKSRGGSLTIRPLNHGWSNWCSHRSKEKSGDCYDCHSVGSQDFLNVLTQSNDLQDWQRWDCTSDIYSVSLLKRTLGWVWQEGWHILSVVSLTLSQWSAFCGTLEIRPVDFRWVESLSWTMVPHLCFATLLPSNRSTDQLQAPLHLFNLCHWHRVLSTLPTKSAFMFHSDNTVLPLTSG